MSIPPGRFCCDCRYLLGVRYNADQEDSVSRWRCVHPANINKTEYDLVTGTLIRKFITENLYTLRNQSGECGYVGAWYEEYEPPEHETVTKINKKSLRNVSAEDL